MDYTGGAARVGGIASVLPPGGAIKMSQPLLQQPTRVDWHTRIDLNRATDGSQVEFVADSDATLVHERLWQRDLKLARHFRHGNSVGSVKALVKARSGLQKLADVSS